MVQYLLVRPVGGSRFSLAIGGKYWMHPGYQAMPPSIFAGCKQSLAIPMPTILPSQSFHFLQTVHSSVQHRMKAPFPFFLQAFCRNRGTEVVKMWCSQWQSKGTGAQQNRNGLKCRNTAHRWGRAHAWRSTLTGALAEPLTQMRRVSSTHHRLLRCRDWP
jgi:hypothetical protein